MRRPGARRLVLAALLAVAALALAAAAPPAAAGPEPPSPVATAYNTQRKLAAAPDGSLYAAVSLDVNGVPTVRVLGKAPGGGWSGLPPPTTTGNPSDRASLAIDSLGRLDLAWTEVATTSRQVFFSRYDEGAWTPPFQVSHSPGYAGFPAVAVDARDRVHIAWYALTDPVSSTYEIDYRRLGPTGWTPERSLTHAPQDATNPALAVGPDGAVHIVWAREAPRVATEVAYLRLEGDAFGGDLVLSPPLVPGIAPSLAIARTGALHVVWSSLGRLQHRVWDGDWGPVETVTNGTPAAMNASLAFDPQGRLHVLWDAADGAIYHQILDGTWSAPVALATGGRNFDPSTRWSFYDDPTCGPNAGIDAIWTREDGGAVTIEYLRIGSGPACPGAPTPLSLAGVGLASLAAGGLLLLLSRRRRERPRKR